jgi:PHD/YefM family antitoxin component YafN of YafNO toxin-antitoxin module
MSINPLEESIMPSTAATVEEPVSSEQLDHVAGEKDRLIVVREGKEVAAVVPLEDLEILEELDDLLEQADIEAARKEAQEKGTVALGEVKARLGL